EDTSLALAVSEGRKNEFIAAGAHGAVPDPQAEITFRSCKLTHRRDGRHGTLREGYRRLLELRKQHATALARTWPRVSTRGSVVVLERPGLVLTVNLSAEPQGGLSAWQYRLLTGDGDSE